jgi:excisionase family DNA binding protein
VSALLSVEDAAAYLDVKPRTIYDWRRQRKGPVAVRIGRLVKFRVEDLDTYISQNVEGSTS